VAVTGLSSGVTQLSVGTSHSCAVTNTNGLKCWGNGSYGRLGDGTTNQRSAPVEIFPSGSGVIAVSLGDVSTCALFSGGSVQCWGRNYSGQLGTGGTTDSLSPTPVPTLTSGVVAISVGENSVLSGQASHACALMTDGSVQCWGDNTAGQIGDGTTSQRLTPTAVVGLPAPAVGISAGAKHTCAVLDTGALYCWGLNASQQLGDGTVTPRPQPTQVYGLSSGIAAVAAGSVHTCAMTTTSDVKCWGDNVYGQLGDGTNIARSQPRDITFNDPGTLPPYTTAPQGSGGQATSTTTSGQGGSTTTDPQPTMTTVPQTTSPPASTTTSTAAPNVVTTTTTAGPGIVTTTPPGTEVPAEVTTTAPIRLPTVGRESGRTAGAAWLMVAIGLSVMVLRRSRVVEK
jgi:alpha-tubulin suppressor-like RCC1 family protein